MYFDLIFRIMNEKKNYNVLLLYEICIPFNVPVYYI